MKYDRVTVNALQRAMHENEGGHLLIDVRRAADFALQHIAGSVNFPLEDLAAHIAMTCRSTLIYLVCDTGKLATTAAEELRDHGFHNVLVVAGGLKAWHAQGFPFGKLG